MVYHYQAWTRLRYQRFKNRLKVEPRVGTPIRQKEFALYFFLVLLRIAQNDFYSNFFIKVVLDGCILNGQLNLRIQNQI